MIIRSLLDTDLYKFTTSYAYMKMFPYACGNFAFSDRDSVACSDTFINRLRDELKKMSTVCLTQEEKDYMIENCRFIPFVYWEWLSSFHYEPEKIKVYKDEDKQLHIEVTDLLYKATLYEVPLLAIVSEIRNEMMGYAADNDDVISRLYEKVKLSNDNQLSFSEFGTRRRFSFDIQDAVICYINEQSIYCTGTSNCYFAKKYRMKMIGTHPHEWFMFHGAQFGYKHANYMALEDWVIVYDGDLGIALADTYTFDVFLRDISRKQAKLFDGLRCDSGNEFEFIDRLIARYKEFGIDSTTKVIIFSNALDFNKALDIKNYCKGKIRCAFGIGTNLSNDTGNKPANIVMKLAYCRMSPNQHWRECVKLSDDIGKHTGESGAIDDCMNQLDIY